MFRLAKALQRRPAAAHTRGIASYIATQSQGDSSNVLRAVAAGLALCIGATNKRSSCEEAIENVVVSEYNANDPMEDRHFVKEMTHGRLFGVLDGHGGYQCADFAQKRFATVMQNEMGASLASTPEQISFAMTRAFLRVEREYLYQVKTAFDVGFGDVARTGSCAIIAMVRDDALFVANAGDCRAVLGRRVQSEKEPNLQAMEAVALSNDHNAREPIEQAKLRALHPLEEDIIRCKRESSCYVKGRLQPTRSLGDAYLKYSEFNGTPGSHRSSGRYLPPPYTPPYITAKPEVQHHSIDRARDEFLIIGSDGLWDYLSNEEAVRIVSAAAFEKNDRDAACDDLVRTVLERAAVASNMDYDGIKALMPGRTRRSRHDDVTCLVIYLKDGEARAKQRTLSVLSAADEADINGNSTAISQ